MYSVREKRVIRIGTHVGEGEYGDGFVGLRESLGLGAKVGGRALRHAHGRGCVRAEVEKDGEGSKDECWDRSGEK